MAASRGLFLAGFAHIKRVKLAVASLDRLCLIVHPDRVGAAAALDETG
jgi:hypothetical protein